MLPNHSSSFFFFNDTATTEIYTLSLPDALPIFQATQQAQHPPGLPGRHRPLHRPRSEEHTSELQSPCNLVCRLLLEKKKKDSVRGAHSSVSYPDSAPPHRQISARSRLYHSYSSC